MLKSSKSLLKTFSALDGISLKLAVRKSSISRFSLSKFFALDASDKADGPTLKKCITEKY